jgi:hypothetical protein
MKTHAENISQDGPIWLRVPDVLGWDPVSTAHSASKIAITAFVRSIRVLNSALFFLTVYKCDRISWAILCTKIGDKAAEQTWIDSNTNNKPPTTGDRKGTPVGSLTALSVRAIEIECARILSLSAFFLALVDGIRVESLRWFWDGETWGDVESEEREVCIAVRSRMSRDKRCGYWQ